MPSCRKLSQYSLSVTAEFTRTHLHTKKALDSLYFKNQRVDILHAACKMRIRFFGSVIHIYIYMPYTCKYTPVLTAESTCLGNYLRRARAFIAAKTLSLFLQTQSYYYYQNINTPNQKRL